MGELKRPEAFKVRCKRGLLFVIDWLVVPHDGIHTLPLFACLRNMNIGSTFCTCSLCCTGV